MAFLVWQLTGLLIATTVLLAAALTSFPTLMKGQVEQWLHLVIPGSSLFGIFVPNVLGPPVGHVMIGGKSQPDGNP